jgi:hypothetical protein
MVLRAVFADVDNSRIASVLPLICFGCSGDNSKSLSGPTKVGAKRADIDIWLGSRKL